jgi:hypothetical protein
VRPILLGEASLLEARAMGQKLPNRDLARPLVVERRKVVRRSVVQIEESLLRERSSVSWGAMSIPTWENLSSFEAIARIHESAGAQLLPGSLASAPKGTRAPSRPIQNGPPRFERPLLESDAGPVASPSRRGARTRARILPNAVGR